MNTARRLAIVAPNAKPDASDDAEARQQNRRVEISLKPHLEMRGAIYIATDGKVYLKRGAREGVARGQTFTVGTLERLRDPNSGEVLDVTMEKAGSIIVEQVREKISIGRVIEGAENIQKGMSVVLPTDS